MKKLFLSSVLMMMSSTTVMADQPGSFFCTLFWSKTQYIYAATGSTTAYNMLDSGSGTATTANPDLTLSVTNATSTSATASSTIGIDAEVVATTTIGVSVGWTKSITTSYNLDWNPGVTYTARLDEKFTTWTGPCAFRDKDTSVICGCTKKTHWHNGTWSAAKYNGTRVVQNP